MTREEAIAYFKKNAIRIKGIMAEEDEALKDRLSKSLEATNIVIKALEQEQKTGHWILANEQNKEDVENDNYRFICSECHCSDIHAKGTIVSYCWNCGAKMVEL